MTKPNLLELDNDLRHESEVCKRGVETEFWRLIKEKGARLQADALNEWMRTDPTDVGMIAQLQMTAKVVDKFIALIEETATLA